MFSFGSTLLNISPEPVVDYSVLQSHIMGFAGASGWAAEWGASTSARPGGVIHRSLLSDQGCMPDFFVSIVLRIGSFLDMDMFYV